MEAWTNLEAAIYEASEYRAWKLCTIMALFSHTVIAVALIVAYVTVSAIGDDATLLLTILGGYLGGAVIGGATTVARRNGNHHPPNRPGHPRK